MNTSSSEILAPHLRRNPRAYARLFQGLILGVTAVFICGGLGWLPLYIAIPLIMVLYGRFVVVVHETTHCIAPAKASWFMRVMPALLGPVVGGYRESWYLHHRHHAALLGPDDPDLHMTDCSAIEGLLRAFVYPEYFVWYQVKQRGFERGYLMELGLRGLAWVALLVCLPFSHWFWLWLTVRVTFALSYFLLAWYLHRIGSEIGTFRKPLPPWVCSFLSVLTGPAGVGTLLYHDIHHNIPAIDAKSLHLVADSIAYDHASAVRGRV